MMVPRIRIPLTAILAVCSFAISAHAEPARPGVSGAGSKASTPFADAPAAAGGTHVSPAKQSQQATFGERVNAGPPKAPPRDGQEPSRTERGTGKSAGQPQAAPQRD